MRVNPFKLHFVRNFSLAMVLLSTGASWASLCIFLEPSVAGDTSSEISFSITGAGQIVENATTGNLSEGTLDFLNFDAGVFNSLNGLFTGFNITFSGMNSAGSYSTTYSGLNFINQSGGDDLDFTSQDSSFAFADGDTYTVTGSGTLTGTSFDSLSGFFGLTFDSAPGTSTGEADNFGGVQLKIAVPEPSQYALMGLFGLLIGGVKFFSNKEAAPRR